MDPTQLADIEEIKQLKARYFRFLDAKDWKAWGDVFTEDMEMSVELGRGEPDFDVSGRDNVVKSVSATLEGTTTTHHGHMPEIEITGPDSARGIWSMYDMVVWGDKRDLKGYGHYHETYERGRDGRWRIKSLKLTRLQVLSRHEW